MNSHQRITLVLFVLCVIIPLLFALFSHGGRPDPGQAQPVDACWQAGPC